MVNGKKEKLEILTNNHIFDRLNKLKRALQSSKAAIFKDNAEF